MRVESMEQDDTDIPTWEDIEANNNLRTGGDTNDNPNAEETQRDDAPFGGAAGVAGAGYEFFMNAIASQRRLFEQKIREPTTTCIMRIKRDLAAIYSEPVSNAFIAPEPEDLTKMHVMIVGGADTPYEGGYFYFCLRFPYDYPMKPPAVKFMTTGNGTVYFNPNLHKTGYVCLSILGTSHGPGWNPTASLPCLVMSIQSIMDENPYFTSPYLKAEARSGASEAYNRYITHETLRVAVCDVLERKDTPYPPSFYDVIESMFPQLYDSYVQKCNQLLHLDGTKLEDPFGRIHVHADFSLILKRLDALRSKHADKFVEVNSDDEDGIASDSDSEDPVTN